MSEQTMTEDPPIFKAVNGEVLYRGAWLPERNARELLILFDADRVTKENYFAASADRLHAELAAAIAEAHGQ